MNLGMLAKLAKGSGGGMNAASVVALASSLGCDLRITDVGDGEAMKAALRSQVTAAGLPGAKVVEVEGRVKSGGVVKALLVLFP